MHCTCADIEIVGEDKIRKILDLLNHDVCTVIASRRSVVMV